MALRGIKIIMVGLVLLACAGVQAQEAGKLAYDKQSPEELRMLEYILGEQAWHYRCFGLFRLERFDGPEVERAITKALSDEMWQVRCFAIRAAVRKGIAIPAGAFDEEEEPRVIRMCQRVGVALPEEQVRKIANKELRSRVPERAVLGIEVAARSGDEELIEKAKKKLGQVLTNLNNAVLVTVGDRLAQLLELENPPTSVPAWEQYINIYGKGLKFPEYELLTGAIREQPIAPIAEMDAKTFLEAVDYLDTLHKQDLEVGVLIDGTGSMSSVIHRAQGQTNRLMLTLNDLAQSMKMGVVIYRDEGDRPMLEAVQMTSNVDKVRGFLFEVTAKGGGDFPEAVYEGLSALTQLRWSEEAVKQAVIITDAPAHAHTMGDIEELVKSMRKGGVTLHGLAVNKSDDATKLLEKLTEWGGGLKSPLEATDDLGKLVIRFVIDPKLHTTFDHLYDLYIEMGM